MKVDSRGETLGRNKPLRHLSRRYSVIFAQNLERRWIRPSGHETCGERSLHTEISNKPSEDHLNPDPHAYSSTPFADKCSLTVHAGGGGNGCVSFLREKFVPEGPANGGDGGEGGSVYVKAVPGETSLHKLARRGQVRAGRGGNGQGKSKGGERGGDVLITVPVGTIIREVERKDPRVEDAEKRRRAKVDEDYAARFAREKWVTYPGLSSTEKRHVDAPKLPKPRSTLALAAQPDAPIQLDLDSSMDKPILLAAGAVGGMGNPHFSSQNTARPKFATKGEQGMSISFELELKMLADVGLVGLPNAGKSTLLRALTNSRTRIGDWAFTTLQPSIGTVILDNHNGKPALEAFEQSGRRKTSFTIADIPGLIEDAHLDRGLGLGFLRHIERAAILAFIIDLSSGDSVEALSSLWREVTEYETLREREINAQTELRMADGQIEMDNHQQAYPPFGPPISSKPWFVIANKADLPGTRANYAKMQAYIAQLKQGEVPHPSGRANAWRRSPAVVPISALRGEGVQIIPPLVVDLL